MIDRTRIKIGKTPNLKEWVIWQIWKRTNYKFPREPHWKYVPYYNFPLKERAMFKSGKAIEDE